MFGMSVSGATISEIINISGYSYYEGDKLNAGQHYPIKVGGIIAVRGETSYAEGLFQNIVFRVVGGKVSIEKSLMKKKDKAGKDRKTQKVGMRLIEGKIFLHITKSFGESDLQLKMPRCNLFIRGVEAKPTTAVYAFASKEKVAVYAHKGALTIIMPGSKKKKVRLTEGNFWEYDGSAINEPKKLDDERKLKKLLETFEPLAQISLEKLGE